MIPVVLSKSKYLIGNQCPLYLWVSFHESERLSSPDDVTRYLFEQGHVVHELARELCPDGLNIPVDDFVNNIDYSKKMLQQRRPLFEPSFSVRLPSGQIFARADMLNPVNTDKWDIIEVKSSTHVRDIDIHDVSFQKFCYEKAGLQINKCYIMNINNQYVKHGALNLRQLFNLQDVTTKVDKVSEKIEENINIMFSIIKNDKSPSVAIGRQCNDPYDCPLLSECWDLLPEGNVFNLHRAGLKAFDLFEDGIISIKDIPFDFKLTNIQQIQRDSEISKKPHVDRRRIGEFLKRLRYPLYYLDFETFNPVLPIFDGTRPYQPIPFQFSLHVVRTEQSEPEHFSFLARDRDDPRPKLLTKLNRLLSADGSIVVYNQSFEGSILEQLGKDYPKYQDLVENVTRRFIDLMVPFRRFYFYHPLQAGSISIKKVLPALTGLSYDSMAISNGAEAVVAFQRITYGSVTEREKENVRRDLENYCKFDTEAMMLIVNRLKELV